MYLRYDFQKENYEWNWDFFRYPYNSADLGWQWNSGNKTFPNYKTFFEAPEAAF